MHRWRGQRADLREETVFITHWWLQTSLDRTAKGNAMFKLFFSDFLRWTKAFLIEESSARFLLSYRTTLNSTTGQSPAELLLIFRLKTRLDLMRLDLKGKVFERSEIQHRQRWQRTRVHNRTSSSSKLLWRIKMVWWYHYRVNQPWGLFLKSSANFLVPKSQLSNCKPLQVFSKADF